MVVLRDVDAGAWLDTWRRGGVGGRRLRSRGKRMREDIIGRAVSLFRAVICVRRLALLCDIFEWLVDACCCYYGRHSLDISQIDVPFCRFLARCLAFAHAI